MHLLILVFTMVSSWFWLAKLDALESVTCICCLIRLLKVVGHESSGFVIALDWD
jgi:hypothetical protein